MKTLLLVFACAALALAQNKLDPAWVSNSAAGSITTAGTGTDCSVPNACVWIVAPYSANSLQLSIGGTFSGTLQFESSLDGATWGSVSASQGVSSATAAGAWTFSLPFSFNLTPTPAPSYFRVRAAALASGRPSILLLTSSKSVTGGTSGASTGTANAILSGTALPGACTLGQIFFITSNPAGQQEYDCSAGNVWTKIVGLGNSGALAYTNGSLDIVPSVLPQLAANQTFTGVNTLAHVLGGGAAPSIASGFGTSPAIAGADLGGRLTVGTGGSATTGAITFGTAYATAPACVANDETTTLLVRAAASTTALTLTSASAWGAGDKLTWHCLGY